MGQALWPDDTCCPPVSEAPLTEPFPVQDVFATGVEVDAFASGFVRMTFWVERNVEPGGGDRSAQERQVVAQIVMPVSAYRAAVERHTGMRQ